MIDGILTGQDAFRLELLHHKVHSPSPFNLLGDRIIVPQFPDAAEVCKELGACRVSVEDGWAEQQREQARCYQQQEMEVGVGVWEKCWLTLSARKKNDLILFDVKNNFRWLLKLANNRLRVLAIKKILLSCHNFESQNSVPEEQPIPSTVCAVWSANATKRHTGQSRSWKIDTKHCETQDTDNGCQHSIQFVTGLFQHQNSHLDLDTLIKILICYFYKGNGFLYVNGIGTKRHSFVCPNLVFPNF